MHPTEPLKPAVDQPTERTYLAMLEGSTHCTAGKHTLYSKISLFHFLFYAVRNTFLLKRMFSQLQVHLVYSSLLKPPVQCERAGKHLAHFQPGPLAHHSHLDCSLLGVRVGAEILDSGENFRLQIWTRWMTGNSFACLSFRIFMWSRSVMIFSLGKYGKTWSTAQLMSRKHVAKVHMIMLCSKAARMSDTSWPRAFSGSSPSHLPKKFIFREFTAAAFIRGKGCASVVRTKSSKFRTSAGQGEMWPLAASLGSTFRHASTNFLSPRMKMIMLENFVYNPTINRPRAQGSCWHSVSEEEPSQPWEPFWIEIVSSCFFQWTS